MQTRILIFFAFFIIGNLYCQNEVDHTTNLTTIDAHEELSIEYGGIAVYPELLGKGFYSFNLDFPLVDKHRMSFGLTALDYDIADHEGYQVGDLGTLTGGLMYYYLIGKKRSFFELGAGFSMYHRFDLDLKEDSILSLHGVIGYRYQKKNGLLFRIGFTPFKRVNNWFLPLFGVSLGYSW